MNVWVVNASPLILLGKIGRLSLLKELSDQFSIPNSVSEEILAGPEYDHARKWIQSPDGQQHVIADSPPPHARDLSACSLRQAPF